MIQPDHWIRKMAYEHRMIDPYSERSEHGISFGLSSFGYDLRCMSRFRIFAQPTMFGEGTPVIDPKHFDPSHLYDVDAPYCDIPANSVALTSSVEHFRIPPDVLCIVLGKSTYARCFSADTQVALVDGTAPTLEEMAQRADDGELFWGYSIGAYGRIGVSLLESPRFIGRDSLLEVTLDNGATINCTPDHIFLMRDGRETIADELKPGDSLMPLYRSHHRGYEMVYQPLNGFLNPTHRLADEWNIHYGIYPDAPGTHRHHRDMNRRNNNPWNIERMEASAHIRLHNDVTYGMDFDPEGHSIAIKNALGHLMSDPSWRETYAEQQRAKAHSFRNDDRFTDARALQNKHSRESWTDERRAWRSELTKRYFEQPEHRQRRGDQSREYWAQATEERRHQQAEIARQINLRTEITADLVRAALDQTGSIRGAARLLNCDRAVFRRFPEVIHAFKGKTVRNHKVTDIRSLPGTHDVYCLTVPDAGNFALESGVFVHNCGLIVNVTPLEPGWKGHITMDLSNTAPLPIRVYAYESIAQVLFLQGASPCEVSYDDKRGKYQHQGRDVVLPRVKQQ